MPTKRNLYGVFPKNQLFADLNRTQPVAKGVQLRRQLATKATGDLAAMRDVLGKLVRAADRVLVRGGHVHVQKKDRWRCPVYGRKCHVHDYLSEESSWRGMDFRPVMVRRGARVPRVCCGEHGVLTAAVPWAKHGSRFTLDFAYSATWMVKSGRRRRERATYS